jgi:hypothetical protein
MRLGCRICFWAWGETVKGQPGEVVTAQEFGALVGELSNWNRWGPEDQRGALFPNRGAHGGGDRAGPGWHDGLAEPAAQHGPVYP